jgi:hypothetical protein
MIMEMGMTVKDFLAKATLTKIPKIEAQDKVKSVGKKLPRYGRYLVFALGDKHQLLFRDDIGNWFVAE